MTNSKKAVLEDYYRLWMDGKTPSQIKRKLKLTDGKYKRLLPDFLNFCRHKIQFEPRQSLVKKTDIRQIELTPELQERFLQFIVSGLSIDKAALLLDVPVPTVLNFWFLENPSFKAQVDNAIKFVNAQATMSLYKRVRGYDINYEETSHTEGVNKDGETFDSDTTTKKVKHVLPDVNAAKFWLFNRDPENWSIDGVRTGKGKKGKILEFIESQADDVSVDDMEKYDKEQITFDDEHYKEK